MTASGVDTDGEEGTSGGFDLSPTVAQQHRRIDTDRWDDIYVVGDPHGCLDAVERLFDRLDFTPSDLAIFVGDLVRKGPDSRGVLDLVRKQDNVVSVRGNNEQGLVDGDKTAPDLGPEDLAFVERIRREADHAREGEKARIVAKANRLEDPGITRELYAASRAGVDIDLIIRDICRLRPGVEGISETVTVRSLVGRFLEHSRIWHFHNGGDPEFFVGSADWMHRNLDDRVEAVAPVEDPDLRTYLRTHLDTLLADNRLAWDMQPDGSYVQRTPGEGEVVDTHERAMRRAEREEPNPGDEPVAVDLEGPLAPDSEATDSPIRFPETFFEPSLDEVVRCSDVDPGVPGDGSAPTGETPDDGRDDDTDSENPETTGTQETKGS